MSTLRQQLAEMQKQLDLSVQASKATQIIEKCCIVISKTDTVAGHYGRLKYQYPALQSLPSDLRVNWKEDQRNELKNAANSVNNLLSQWSRWLNNQTQLTVAANTQASDEPLDETLTTQEPTAYDIIQNDSLTNCVSQALSLHRTLSDQLKNAWEEWQQILYQQIQVDSKTLDAQQKLEKLKEIADEYLSLRDKFDTLIQPLPENGESVTKIRAMAEHLNTLRGMMKTDWPEAVQHFLDRINGPQRSKPTLSALTTEVFEWLRDEDMLEEFVITRK
ncbi:TPA: hypothetical protein QHC19_005552 [Raoultella ornithinolytica]|mgnify:CR=1 FL=1|nr:hypothetical protein [Klebsiella quasipneumoniae]HDT5900944.1 hypothetical protein [Raoultella ornithinolytica]HDT5918017.1 hypothetical protein [Raoultella ornithinolytica]HDT6018958.1 hypothetical protein [Raoultella ornithinolytica]